MKRHKTDITPAEPAAVNPREINQFNMLADEWWNPDGPMAPLHRMNPVRMEYVTQTLSNHFNSIKGLKILDVGCGGGLVSEPLARLGARMTGIDGAKDLLEIARDHAKSQNLSIDYKNVLTSDLIAKGQQFDVVLALEVIEHIPDQAGFVRDIAQLVKPGGLVIFSTLNRSPAAFAFGVVAAEYVLHWLPRGTHDWKNFVKPSELYQMSLDAGLTPQETMGLVFHPIKDAFSLDPRNMKINYFLTATHA